MCKSSVSTVSGMFLSAVHTCSLVGCEPSEDAAHCRVLMRLQAMGLASVRHFSRLLPLLLEWLHAPDMDSRLAAAPVLHAVLKHTWPRLPAHAGVIWQHVAKEYAREASIALKMEGDQGPLSSTLCSHTQSLLHMQMSAEH